MLSRRERPKIAQGSIPSESLRPVGEERAFTRPLSALAAIALPERGPIRHCEKIGVCTRSQSFACSWSDWVPWATFSTRCRQ
jgi:hypothetical protein